MAGIINEWGDWGNSAIDEWSVARIGRVDEEGASVMAVPPTVTLDTPLEDAQVVSPFTMTWTFSDADGDTQTHVSIRRKLQ